MNGEANNLKSFELSDEQLQEVNGGKTNWDAVQVALKKYNNIPEAKEIIILIKEKNYINASTKIFKLYEKHPEIVEELRKYM